MPAESASKTPAPRLILSFAILCVSIAAALLFASAFKHAPTNPAPAADAQPGNTDSHKPTDHKEHAETKTGPVYYTGGLWSDELGLASTLDAAILSATGGKAVICESAISGAEESVVILDKSPIRYSANAAAPEGGKPTLVLSIDHAGNVSSIEYPAAAALQKYITAQLPKYSKILIIEPLPGPDEDPDEDWTYLNFEGDDKIDFYTPKRQASPADTLLGVYENLRGASAPTPADTPTLIAQLGGQDRAKAADARWLLGQQGPYAVVPQLNKWVDIAEGDAREQRVYEALMIRRALDIHADTLIKEAAASDNPTMRALAARTIGDLAEHTSDPIGLLTRLAEDNEMTVRYAALTACLAMPSRRAAGVAQLVEPYEMTDAMRATYQGAMATLLTYGEPIQADSKANRLRRMSLTELLNQQRNALTCTILLERTDLPDDKIDEVLGQLAQANGRGPLVALLNLTEAMNPRTLAKRLALMDKLVGWKTNELNAQTPRLKEMALGGGLDSLRRAAAAAMVMSSAPEAVLTELGNSAIAYESLGLITDASVLQKWAAPVIQQSSKDAPLAATIAAIDAIQYLPADSVTIDNAAMLLGLAKESDATDLRFAAIRAINALPEAIKPDGIEAFALTSLTIAAIPGQMKYDKDKLTVPAGRPVELTLVNPDTMEHNLVITLPGRAQEIGIAMSADPNAAAAIGYVPKDSDAVLHFTKMTGPGTSDTLRFFAPTKPGSYEYVCTFPGHYTSMRGVLEVVAP